MKDLADYNDTTSEYELHSFLYDKVMTREITSFSGLKGFAAPILKDKRTHPVIMRVFELIKRLNWGFFSGISLATHKKLWRELVIPDQLFPEAGDLKRTISISNLYISMLDIHGYTKFCQDSRKNLSMLHTLDRTINNEIRDISTQCQTVSQRERGDEIILVSAAATDALTAALCIIDYFAGTNVVDDPAIPTQRTGDATILPILKISAGITGGNTSIPLIITENGNLSGFLLNTAARLQSRANELSPKESKVMVTTQVYLNYVKENTNTKGVRARHNAVYFFDTGIIEFKGVQLPTCEAVFKTEERYKEQFSEEMGRLYTSIRESLWEQRIFLDLMDLLSKSANVMPRFSVTPKEPINGIQQITNDSLMQLCRLGTKAYVHDEDYAYAVNLLREFVGLLEMIPAYDRLILDYLRGITEKYEMLLNSYESSIDKEIDEKASIIFSGNHLKTYYAAKNGAAIFEKLRLIGRKSTAITKKKNLWYNLIKSNKEGMSLTIYSGKK
ncbi:MAG: hypothetical protein LBP32_02920 [Spirochaetaceae bacterium]|nr:hypothetical protein [Spirochaetaceae bacterium]